MRIASLLLLDLIVLFSIAANGVALAADESKEIKQNNHLRSDHRDLQHFPYLKTAQVPPVQQAAASDPEPTTTVVSIESQLETPVAESIESDGSNEEGEVEIGYRFNKFTMYPEYSGPEFTLTSDDYPLSEERARTLSFESNAYSVVTENDVRMKDHDIEHYIEEVGGYPPRPTKKSSDPYWQEFKEVVKRVRGRQLGKLPPKGIFRAPTLWENFTAAEVAEAVHDEYPGLHQANMILSFITSDEGIKLDHDILPFRCRNDFIGTEVRLAALNTWSITTVAPINFAAKWHVGQMRPEEMVWKYVNKEIAPRYIPKYARRLIRQMNITKATDFTQYPEGSPLHPSWPAMHSAASSASLWLAVVADLTEDQYCQVLRTDHSVAYARTIAGVHYPKDNIAGLNMGQKVIAEYLPKHLAEVYGADEEAVKAKIRRLQFDWNTYSPRKCTVQYNSAEPRSAVEMGLRFNKFEMYPEYNGPAIVLRSPDYPLSDEMANTLSYESSAFSVVTQSDVRMEGHDVEHYIAAAGGYPPRPSPDPTAPYWAEFREVVEQQVNRRNDKLPPKTHFYPPSLWEDFDAVQVAEAVHDEYPGLHQANMLLSFITGDEGIELDHEILPFRCRNDFIGTEVRLAALNTWSITTVAPINFSAKWHVGQLRPEEMAWKIADGEVPKEQVPEDIYNMISDMNLESAPDFTQYPEGSPNHPSWPAMHSAASSASLWLAVVADLTDEQYCQVLRTDHSVAYARTVAGVHYPGDNTAGLNMGQNVIAHELADHLVEVYGANRDAVNAKIDRLRFDWNTYNPEDCSVVYGVEDNK